MFARVSTVATTSGRAEDTVRHIQDEILPRIEKQPGSQGGLWLMDRQTGKVLAITLWKDEAAMLASRGQVTQATGDRGRELGIATQSAEGFEVVAQV
jgi:hypothetical protein